MLGCREKRRFEGMKVRSASRSTASRLATFVFVAIFVFVLLAAGFLFYLGWNGDQLAECEYADCGPRGEFANDYGVLFLAAFVLVSIAAGWAVARRTL
jgi:hypothetical protein